MNRPPATPSHYFLRQSRGLYDILRSMVALSRKPSHRTVCRRMRDYGMAAVGAERKFDEPAISEKGNGQTI